MKIIIFILALFYALPVNALDFSLVATARQDSETETGNLGINANFGSNYGVDITLYADEDVTPAIALYARGGDFMYGIGAVNERRFGKAGEQTLDGNDLEWGTMAFVQYNYSDSPLWIRFTVVKNSFDYVGQNLKPASAVRAYHYEEPPPEPEYISVVDHVDTHDLWLTLGYRF